MQRRKFIFLSAVSGAAIGFAGVNCHFGHPAYEKVLDKPRQLSYICDTKTIREIGLAFRKQKPSEADAGQLIHFLSADSSGKSFSPSVDQTLVQNLIDQKIVQDFEKGDMVVVKGWILSVTEARQCALFAVNNP